MDFLNQFEAGFLHSIHDALQCGFLDTVLPVITKLGDAGIFWIVLAVVLMFFKKTRRAGFTMGVSLVIGLLFCNITLKPIVARIRPYDLDPTITLLIPPEHDFSFPSGHTVASVESAVALFLCHKKSGIAAICLAVVIAFSRIYLMVHYPTDVIVAAVLGVIIAVAASYIANWIIKKTKIPCAD